MFIDSLLTFAQNNALILIIAIAVVIIIISVIKTIVKWILTLVVVVGLVFLVLNYDLPEVGIGKQLIAETVNVEQKEYITDLVNQGESASYKSTGNGGFIIAAGGIVLEGSTNSDKITLTKGKISIDIDKTETLEKYITLIKEKGHSNDTTD